MLRTNRTTARRAFTLVELMIGAAITVMIMTILSICFQTSMSAMSSMRAQGDAADQLRALNTVMKRDIKADRSMPTDGAAGVLNTGRRASDYPIVFSGSPSSGFFYLESPPSTNEGNDGSFDSFRNAPAAPYPNGTRIWMTSVLAGGDDSKLYTATVGGTVYSSEAAEVSYFLLPAGQTTGSPAATLYNLYRRQRLVAINSDRQAILQSTSGVPFASDVISFQPGLAPGFVNTLSSIAVPTSRPPMGWTPSTVFSVGTRVQNGGQCYVCVTTGISAAAGGPAGAGTNIADGTARWNYYASANSGGIFTPLGGSRVGDDIILSNVLSFEIKPYWVHGFNGNNNPVPFSGRPAGVPAYPQPNHDAPFDDLTKATANTLLSTFDSINPLPIRMQSMQLRIRIYDPKVKTSRQMTMILDL